MEGGGGLLGERDRELERGGGEQEINAEGYKSEKGNFEEKWQKKKTFLEGYNPAYEREMSIWRMRGYRKSIKRPSL